MTRTEPRIPRPTRTPVPRQTDISARRRTLVVLALALGGFGIGTTEFVAMGLLRTIATSFAITEDAAGYIISAYALGVVVGAPLITTLTGRIPRRRLLLLLMAAFTIGNALSVFATSYEMLILSRFIAGVPHGAYFGVAALVAASLAEPGKRGKAVAMTGMGLAVATVIGVPIAQAIGDLAGWNAAFGFVAVLGVITVAALWFTVPHMTQMPATNPLVELSALARSQVWLTLGIGTVGFGGMFAVYTYISWTMTEVGGLKESWIWLVLMSYGIGAVAGTYIGGLLADRNLEFGILGTLVALIAVLLLFTVTAHNPITGMINFGVIGFFGAALVPSLQTRLMDTAGKAQTLAASLNHSALNLANAGGAAVGGQVIAAGLGYTAPAVAGAVMALAGVLVWAIAFTTRRRAARARG